METLQGTLIAGAWKFSSDQLQDFIGHGCPNLAVPRLAAGDAWFDSQMLDRYAAAIEQRLRDMVAALAPAVAPPEAIDGSQTTITLPPTPEMKSFLVAQRGRDPFRVPGQPTIPFTSNADIFAGSKQLAILRRLCSDATNPASGLTRLYSSPTDFQRLCSAAKAQFENSFVSVSKTYRPEGSYGFGLVCSWQVSCRDFGGQSDVLSKLV